MHIFLQLLKLLYVIGDCKADNTFSRIKFSRIKCLSNFILTILSKTIYEDILKRKLKVTKD